MKKDFIRPEMNVETFDFENVVTVSGVKTNEDMAKKSFAETIADIAVIEL